MTSLDHFRLGSATTCYDRRYRYSSVKINVTINQKRPKNKNLRVFSFSENQKSLNSDRYSLRYGPSKFWTLLTYAIDLRRNLLQLTDLERQQQTLQKPRQTLGKNTLSLLVYCFDLIPYQNVLLYQLTQVYTLEARCPGIHSGTRQFNGITLTETKRTNWQQHLVTTVLSLLLGTHIAAIKPYSRNQLKGCPS